MLQFKTAADGLYAAGIPKTAAYSHTLLGMAIQSESAPDPTRSDDFNPIRSEVENIRLYNPSPI